jgi:putative hemolysin
MGRSQSSSFHSPFPRVLKLTRVGGCRTATEDNAGNANTPRWGRGGETIPHWGAFFLCSQLRAPCSRPEYVFSCQSKGRTENAGALPREPITSMSTELAVATLAGLTVCAFISAFFSGMETALFSIKAWHLDRWRKQDPSSAERYEVLMKMPRVVLSVILLADTLVNLVLVVLALWFANSLAVPFPNWVKTLLLFALIVLVCDLSPKVLALANPFRFAKQALVALEFLLPVLGPFSRELQSFAERIAGFLFPGKPEAREQLDDEELIMLVEISAEEGHLRSDEREMIAEVIRLGNKTVKDCMTPRVDAFTIPDTWTNEQAIHELRIKRHGRVPVFGDSPDEILGILEVKSFLLDPREHYTENLEPPSFVPETMRALDLLRAFLTHPQRLAIVVDEFGGTEGVITFNDIVEEILADVAPRSDEELYLEEAGDSVWLASGSARLEDLGEALNLNLASEGIDTVNGLIFNRLGYVPRAGATVQVPPLEFQIRQSTRRRVLEVLVQRINSLKGYKE